MKINKVITEIKEVEYGDNCDGYEGISITLEDGELLQFLISGYQCCCEDAGYLTSHDDTSEFIGAKLLEVVFTDNALKSYDAELPTPSAEIEGVIFITCKTDRGDFQFVAYNSHNGYYGHDVKVVWRDQVKFNGCV